MGIHLFFWLLVTTPGFKGKSSEYVQKECQQLHPIDSEMFMMLNTTGSLMDESKNEPKCFVLCLLERASMMNKDGTVNLMEVKKLLQDNGDAETSCAAAVKGEKNMCEKAYRFVKCIMSVPMKTATEVYNLEDDIMH